MTRTVFTGFDSAWGGRAPGAIASLVTEDEATLRVREAPRGVSWDEAIATLTAAPYENHVVSIDQGLVVTNPTGMRPVERTLAKALLAGFGCAAYPSNTSNASCFGPTARVWDLVEALARRGFRQEPMAAARRTPGRFYFECYPHPALLGLFSLPRLLRYKKHHHDPMSWGSLLELLRALKDRSPALVDANEHAPEGLPQTKQNEDKLDALISAYVAAYLWFHGTTRSTVLGNLATGYIVTPHSEATLAAYMREFLPKDLNPAGVATSLRPGCPGIPAPAQEPRTRQSVVATTEPAPVSGSDVVLLVNDTGNIWRNHNRWIPCCDRAIELRFFDVAGEPAVGFVPFGAHGDVQGGLKVRNDLADRATWKELSAGARNQHVLRYHVVWRFL